MRSVEPLVATREDVVLPNDMFSKCTGKLFVRINNPKTAKRGNARVQHGSVCSESVVAFVEAVVGPMQRTERLWPFSQSAYRRRFDKLLSLVGVTKNYYTPGGLRGGGAVRDFVINGDIANLMWKMRIRSQSTLAHYLQEVVTEQSLLRLPTSSRDIFKLLARIFPALRLVAIASLKAGCAKPLVQVLFSSE
ncbi:unnamed protein product [Polarella glacialis]|uniref:Uncharacterized protein n=1 Tax=Polarella glacialis TaxID=89957 RepID=A0A813FPY8_POLGL|nr:unnamed protein product [Polarella glacialis]CAE8729044.1 unnamed protein product [Polarella glacialis]